MKDFDNNQSNEKNSFKLNKEHFTAILFMIVVVVMTIGLFQVNKTDETVQDVVESEQQWIVQDFLDEYNETIEEDSSIFEKFELMTEIAESNVLRETYRREEFNDLYGLAHLAMGKKMISDSQYDYIYKTKYDQIVIPIKEADDEIIDFALESTISLKNELDALGIPFVYIQAPFRLPPNEDQLPFSVEDFSNENWDKYIEGLNAAGVDTFDLREPIFNSGKSQQELFYQTDHHWRIETAFDATGHIIDLLNSDYDFNISEKYKALENYNFTTYEDFFLGMVGRRTGSLYGGVDDFTLITPDFETSYSIMQNDWGNIVNFEGTFEEAVLSNDYMENAEDISKNRYAVYHGDNMELVFTNNLIEDGKVLIIKDSFALPVYSFLSLGVNEVRALDLRLYNESVLEYAKLHRPEVVILMYNAGTFNKAGFEFK